MTLYAVVALGDLGVIVHIDFNDTDVFLLTLRRVPELSAESVVNKTSISTRVSNTYWSRHQWTQNRGKAKTYIFEDVPESFR